MNEPKFTSYRVTLWHRDNPFNTTTITLPTREALSGFMASVVFAKEIMKVTFEETTEPAL